MSQRELYRQISDATGESVSVIENLGFVELRRVAFERESPWLEPDDLDVEFDAATISGECRPLTTA